MKLDRGPVPVDFARELVEEALAIASRNADAELQAAFLEEREAVDSIETIDIRERHLDALESVLARHPGLDNVVSSCFVKLARAKEDEKATCTARTWKSPPSSSNSPPTRCSLSKIWSLC